MNFDNRAAQAEIMRSPTYVNNQVLFKLTYDIRNHKPLDLKKSEWK